jgi:putative FmdB family regulatory protein
MPLYDFRCERCGDFRALRPMRESSASAACLACDTLSPRVIVAPFLAGKGAAGGPAPGSFDRSRFRHICGNGCAHSSRG